MPYDVISLLNSGGTPLYLAPQAGVSESPFRRLCRRFGADVLVSEFVSAAGIVQNSKRSREYLRFDEAERPIGIQIFGADHRLPPSFDAMAGLRVPACRGELSFLVSSSISRYSSHVRTSPNGCSGCGSRATEPRP